jgi:hypothetical protein
VFCRQRGIDKVNDRKAGVEITLPLFFSFHPSGPLHWNLGFWSEKIPLTRAEAKKFSLFLPHFW